MRISCEGCCGMPRSTPPGCPDESGLMDSALRRNDGVALFCLENDSVDLCGADILDAMSPSLMRQHETVG